MVTRTQKKSHIFKGVIVRAVFGLHIIMGVWRLVDAKHNLNYWAILTTVWLLMVEGALTLGLNRHGEWRWFNPCIFIYLSGIVPCIAFLEYALLEQRLAYQHETSKTLKSLDSSSCMHLPRNMTYLANIAGVVIIPIALSSESWSLTLQQILLFLLIMGRWLLPKGRLSRQKLSNLLLTNIGMAADILEFLSEGVETEEIACERVVILIILGLWAWSLVQFTLPIATQSDRKISVVDLEKKQQSFELRLRELEVWGVISVVVMQDGPFLAMRLYLAIVYKIVDQSLLFFTAKNALVVLLQMYRLWVLLCLQWEPIKGQFNYRLSRRVETRGHTKPHSDSEVIAMEESTISTMSEHKKETSSTLNGGTRRPQNKPVSVTHLTVPVAVETRPKKDLKTKAHDPGTSKEVRKVRYPKGTAQTAKIGIQANFHGSVEQGPHTAAGKRGNKADVAETAVSNKTRPDRNDNKKQRPRRIKHT